MMMDVNALQKYLSRNGISVRALARMYDIPQTTFIRMMHNDGLTQAQIAQLIELLKIEDWQEVFFPALVIADAKRAREQAVEEEV